jgi:hypothetical protein
VSIASVNGDDYGDRLSMDKLVWLGFHGGFYLSASATRRGSAFGERRGHGAGG